MEENAVHKGISATIVALFGLLVIAGCGGNSSLSKSDYEQKLELVCNAGLKNRSEFISELSREYQKRQQEATVKEQAENLRKLMTVYQGTTEEIADIGLPDQGQEKAEELLKSREDAVAKIKADPGSTLPEFSEIFAKSFRIAKEFGAHSCAS
jgi:hypothetical protein